MSSNSFDHGMNVIYADQNQTIRNALNLTGMMLGIMSIVALAVGFLLSGMSEGVQTGLYFAAFVVQIIFIFAIRSNQNSEKAIHYCLAFSLIEGFVVSIFCHWIGATAGEVFTGILATAAITVVTGYIGYNSKNMSSLGKFLFIAIVALLIATIANIFMQSSALYFGLIWVGAIIFSMFIMYDVNQMRHDPNLTYPVIALNLFIDIIGLFKFIMQIIGSSNDD